MPLEEVLQERALDGIADDTEATSGNFLGKRPTPRIGHALAAPQRLPTQGTQHGRAFLAQHDGHDHGLRADRVSQPDAVQLRQ
ncbi:hypothetical protein D3C73_1326700 [compost metagenome]